MPHSNRDKAIIRVFQMHYVDGAPEVPFSKDDIEDAVRQVGYTEKNLPDLRYQYTSGRARLPREIDKFGPWMIAGKGKGKYAFVKLKSPPNH